MVDILRGVRFEAFDVLVFIAPSDLIGIFHLFLWNSLLIAINLHCYLNYVLEMSTVNLFVILHNKVTNKSLSNKLLQ